MARLPQASDLQRLPMPAASPGIRVNPIDYGPEAAGAQSIAKGVQGLADAGGKFIDLQVKADAEIDDYATRKRLLDLKWQTEKEEEDFSRTMPQGGAGYTAAWQERFRERAKEFVGKDDANIPAHLRNKVGLLLKHHETQLLERAQRREWSERDRTMLEGLESTVTTYRSRVEADPSRLAETEKEIGSLIESARLPPATADAYRKKVAETYKEAAAYAWANSIKTADDRANVKALLAPDTPDKRTAPLITKDGDMTVVASGTTGAKFRVAAPYAERFSALIADLEAEGVQIKGEQSGGYNPRNIAGTNIRSKHADGMAVDINWTDNERGKPGAIRDVLPPEKIREIAKRNGLVWGGDWKNPDDMHFEVDPASRPSVPMAQRGITTAAGLTSEAEHAGPLAGLSLAKRRAAWNHAEQVWGKQIHDIKSQIDSYSAEAAAGKMPDAPILQAMRNRVDQIADPILTAHFDKLISKADVTATIKAAPPPAADWYVKQIEDRIGPNPTPVQYDILQHAKKVAESIRKAVNDDPMTWAHENNINVPLADGKPPVDVFGEKGSRDKSQIPKAPVKLGHLEFGAPEIGQQLDYRIEQAKGVARYVNQPIQVFTKTDRDTLKNFLEVGGQPMLHVLGNIAASAERKGVDPALLLHEVTKDAGAVSYIGSLVANNADQNVLETSAKALSWKAQLGEKFESTLDKPGVKADLGEYADLMASWKAGDAKAMRELAGLVYEYDYGRGVRPFNADKWHETVQKLMGQTKDAQGDTYGGVGYANASWFDNRRQNAVLVPAGVKSNSFDTLLGALRSDDLAKTGMPVGKDGEPLTIQEIRGATWVSTGPGQYWLQQDRRPDGTRVMALDSGGKPFVMDVRLVLDDIRKRRPDIFMGWDRTTGTVPAAPADPALPKFWTGSPQSPAASEAAMPTVP